MDYKDQLKELFSLNEISCDEEKFDLLAEYAKLLVKKNDIINLISRKDIENVIENHIFHSLLIVKYVGQLKGDYIDIGTGGGLPGIPFGIYYNNLNGLLVDSIQKKVNALNEFISELKLNNLIAVCSRAEDKNFKETYKDKFAIMVNRAVAPLDELIKYFLPLANKNSKMYILKGGDLTDEIKLANKKYSNYISDLKIIDLKYKPSNIGNQKEKKLLIVGINK